MGAQTFLNVVKGKTAREAFQKAVAAAQWESGRGGYTGTIAEKSDFTLIAVPAGERPRSYASQLLDDDDPRISDKWGPAGCVQIDADTFAFFGWASN